MGAAAPWQFLLRAAMVISEVALACVLLVGAGLLLRSFLRVLDIDLGFEPSHAAAIRIDYDDKGNRELRGAILQEILLRITGLPGVEAGGVADMLPLERNRSWDLGAKGAVYDKNKNYDAFVYIVTPGYLNAMGIICAKAETLIGKIRTRANRSSSSMKQQQKCWALRKLRDRQLRYPHSHGTVMERLCR